MPPEIKIEVISFEHFKEIVIDYLVESFKDRKSIDIFYYLIEFGFPKLDKDNIKQFMNGIRSLVFLKNYAVEFGDNSFYWLVSGSDAILINKDKEKIINIS